MNNSSVPLVQASRLPNGYVMIQVMPGVTDPVVTLMQVAEACAKGAQQQLAEERKPSIAVAPLGMRVPRSD